MEREAMEFDVVIVGGGPAGLASAIRLKQLAAEKGSDISVCLIEKGAEIGAHILSGAVMDPRALNELLPELEGRRRAAQCTGQRRPLLHPHRKRRQPGSQQPAAGLFPQRGQLRHSLGNVCRWLGEQAEALGVEIYPGFAGAEVLFDEDGAVKGVATGDMGRLHDGSRRPDLPARHGTARQIHLVRRRLPRPPRQAARSAIQPARRRRSADLRHRHQGTVGNQAGETPARPRHPHRRLAAGNRTPTAAASSTTWKTTRSPSASSSASATATRTCRPSRNSSATRRTRQSASSSKAASASPMAPAP